MPMGLLLLISGVDLERGCASPLRLRMRARVCVRACMWEGGEGAWLAIGEGRHSCLARRCTSAARGAHRVLPLPSPWRRLAALSLDVRLPPTALSWSGSGSSVASSVARRLRSAPSCLAFLTCHHLGGAATLSA